MGMAAIAELLLYRGVKVSGSDVTGGENTERLAALGAEVHIGHSAKNAEPPPDLAIYSLSIDSENEEYLRCRELSVPTV